MTLQERIAQLEPRERLLLNVLVGLVMASILLVLPIFLATSLAGQRSHNRQLREAIDAIHQNRPVLVKREALKAQVLARYQRRAPPLAGFLETQAKKQNLSIPESQPRPAVPHGKDYEERSERFTLRKVDLLSLVKFMEGIATSGYPVTISELNIRKRAPDSYDVSMVVSAFDRKAAVRKEKSKDENPEPADDLAEDEETKPEEEDEP